MFVYLSVVAYFLHYLSLACPCLNKRITYLLTYLVWSVVFRISVTLYVCLLRQSDVFYAAVGIAVMILPSAVGE